jgi:hypothetical protein
MIVETEYVHKFN